MNKFTVAILLLFGVQLTHAQTIVSVQEVRTILTGNSWTNGFEFVSYVSPDKYEVYDVNDVSPTDSNTLVFMGGTLHEFGTNLYIKQVGDELFLDKEREYQLFPAGSRVLFVPEDNALVFRHPTNGELSGVLKMLPPNMDLRKQMEEDLFVYGLIGTYVLEWDPTVQTAFSELYRIDSPLFEEQKYSFGIEYDIPQKILHIGNDVYAFKRRIYQLELIPLKFNAEEEHYAQIKGGQIITLNRADKMKSLDYKNLSTNILTEQQLMLYAGHYPYDVGVASQKFEIRKMLHSFSVMRNQIFAELGYIFKKKEWRDYFTQMSWYKPEYEDVTDRLSEIQKINVEHIQRLEKKWKEELKTIRK